MSAIREVSRKDALPRSHTQSYESRQEQKEARRESKQLTEEERGQLEYLWGGFAAELGIRSMQGSIEARLLRSPPRPDVQRYVIEELARRGGRSDEGSVIQTLYEEHRYESTETVDYVCPWSGKVRRDKSKRVRVGDSFTRHEIRLAIGLLVRDGYLERLGTPMPEADEPRKRWTGFDLRAVRRRMRDAQPASREEQWRRDDERLEGELHTIDCHESMSLRDWSPDESPSSDRARRIMAAMERIPDWAVGALFAAVRQPGDPRSVDGVTVLRLEEAIAEWRKARASVAREQKRRAWAGGDGR